MRVPAVVNVPEALISISPISARHSSPLQSLALAPASLPAITHACARPSPVARRPSPVPHTASRRRPPAMSTSAARDGSPDDNALPATAALSHSASRRSSFSFLRRKSSSETRNGKMSKKQKALAQEEALRRQREAAMRQPPPRLPNHSPLPQIDHFGGTEHDDAGARPDSIAIVSNKMGSYSTNLSTNFSRPSLDHRMPPAASNPLAVPVPPMPAASPSYMDYDPYPRSESMTHRGRYSYASSAISTVGVNSPRRVRRRKDPTPFK